MRYCDESIGSFEFIRSTMNFKSKRYQDFRFFKDIRSNLATIKIRKMAEQQENNQGVNIEIDEQIAEGTYSNLAIINHSPSEFVVDFINIMPGNPKGKVKSRIILTPQHAKRLVGALSDNIRKFEKEHGEIKDQEKQTVPMNFGPTGQA